MVHYFLYICDNFSFYLLLIWTAVSEINLMMMMMMMMMITSFRHICSDQSDIFSI